MAPLKLTLLIVSNANPLREGLSTFFAHHNQITLLDTAGTPAEALAAIARHIPDLALIDTFGYPQDGLTLLQRIKAQWPAIPCCLLTESPALAERARAAGAESALVWGFQTAQLAAEIERLTAGVSTLPASCIPIAPPGS